MLLFHVSFLVIFIGAVFTRYVGYEGMMSIREGQITNQMISDETYIRVWANDGNVTYYKEKKVFATAFSAGKFSDDFSYGSKEVSIEILNYYTNAEETIIEGEGEPMLWLVMSDKGSGRQDFYFTNGEKKKFGGYPISFNSGGNGNGINIHHDGTNLLFSAPDSVSYMNMKANTTEMLGYEQHGCFYCENYCRGSIN
jgi:hypothetical protein